jgi:hypothetical protein
VANQHLIEPAVMQNILTSNTVIADYPHRK